MNLQQNVFIELGLQTHAQPPTWKTRPQYLYPPEKGWPTDTFGEQVIILVVSHNMQTFISTFQIPLSFCHTITAPG